MTESVTVDSLVLDLLEWIGPGARQYDEVLEFLDKHGSR